MKIDFDRYSLIINDKRVMIKSAALHYFRSPGLNVWRDRLSKLKACGYNAVDLYFCWSYHSNEPDKYDFTDIKDIRALLDITAELGLFVIARPGPYINAELSGGGFPTWLFNLPDIKFRNRVDGDYVYSEIYMKAVRKWYSRIIPIINEYRNVVAFQIENEYSTNEAEPDYIQELHDIAREIGVKAPIFHNDAFSACLYSDVVNIYAFDTYPSINMKADWHENPYEFGILDNIEENLKECKPDAPLYIAELQSGWFDKWGGCGYEEIRKKFGKEHINIVTKTALSQGITMFNHFMGCGGTSWGQLACAEVYTSYDFAAPVSEAGIPRENYYKAKEINYFLEAFDLSSTDMTAQEDTLLEGEDEYLYAKLRQDNLNDCKWLFIRNLSPETKNIKVQNRFDVSLKAFDMKILPLELNLLGCKLDFSSFSIFGKVEKENLETIFLLCDKDSGLIVSDFDKEEIPPELSELERTNNTIKFKFRDIPEKDLFSCKFSRGEKTTEFVFLNEETADKTWIVGNKVIIGPNFLMDYPYKAAFSEPGEIKILDISKNTGWQIIKSGNLAKFETPKLGKWTAFKCSPEIDPDYDYSNWNLLADTEGFDCISNKIYDEFIWYKGTFKDSIDRIQISAKHCYAVYLNGTQIFHHDTFHYDFGKELDEEITFEVNKDFLNHSGSNELTVLVQNIGFDKGFENEPDMPRGILSFKTIPHKEIEWRIRGGITPDIEEWDLMPLDNLDNASKNSYLIKAFSSFNLELPENSYCPLCLNLDNPPFDKASIYLNGNLIGQYWKSKGPQTKFYLMDGFINENNLLSLVIWNSDTNYQKIEDYEFPANNVNINIEIISYYGLIAMKEFI